MTSVPFSMTGWTPTLGIGGRQELMLTFQITSHSAAARRLRRLCIGGVRADVLLAVRVREGDQTIFALEAIGDASGRLVTAGDMLAAIYGRGRHRCLQVLGPDFQGDLTAARSRVQLRLRGLSSGDLRAIVVQGHDTPP